MTTDLQIRKKEHYNGSIFHEGFKFHRKYIGKKTCSYLCANNRNKESVCTAKIKLSDLGELR